MAAYYVADSDLYFLNYHDMEEVYRDIYIVRSKWQSLGLELGILITDIDAIETECSGNLGRCLIKLISIWLKKANPKPTWKSLIKALKSNTVGFEQLAELLDHKQQNQDSRAYKLSAVISSLTPQSQSLVGSLDRIKSPISHGTIQGDQTYNQDLYPLKAALTSFQGTPSESPMVKGLTRSDQIEKLAISFRQRNKTIGVFYNHSQSQKADRILHRLSDLLYGGESVAQGFEILPKMANWLKNALLSGVNYFIFVGLPPVATSSAIPQSQSITETTYFNIQRYVQRVAEVVVVCSSQNESRHTCTHTPHYLNNFLWLERENMDEIAEDALALFAAPRPEPFAADGAYFSEMPKLIIMKRQLGKISIMTREMSPDSEFPRIVLLNDCVEDVRAMLGIYTHIQSYNGIFLDGMDINEVTSIFQSMRSPIAYLMIRYLCPIQGATPAQQRMVTPIYKPEAPRLDPTSGEELPIPLYILGDNYRLCKMLFDLLKEDSTAAVSLRLLQADIISVDSGISSMLDSGSHDHDQSSLDNYMLSESDEPIVQTMASAKLFDSALNTMEITQHRSIIPPIGKRLYVLQLPQRSINRHFTHIFFRRSGIFLIVVGLEEMMGDPLIQFEKLCYWLRQIQTYVNPENVKRIVIIGVHDTMPTDIAQSQKVASFLMKLDQAIHETNSKQIMETSRDSLTLSLNLGDPDKCRRFLCQCIDKCMDVMIEQSWCYEQEFYSCTFQPFTQLGSIMSKISRIKAIVASTQDIEDCYNFDDAHYMMTLANYSHACISTDGHYHLICPHFLIDLLLSMETNHHNYLVHAINITAVKRLPVFSAPFPKQQINILMASKEKFRRLVPEEQDAILEWAEKLELIYGLGKLGEHILYFVPFLTTEALGDQASFDWDNEEAVQFQAEDNTVLYAEIHIPLSYQFFYRLIAELLKDVIAVHYMQKFGRCRINLGCMEAIFPLRFVDMSQFSRVYLQHHPLQNMIEFRAKIVKQQLAFLKAVESKLKGALSNSKSHGGSGEDHNIAFSFAVPAAGHTSNLTDSALWTLSEAIKEEGKLDEGEVEELDGVSRREIVLVKTRLMTPDVKREWASSAPQMKEIPSQQFSEWSRVLNSKEDKLALLSCKMGLINSEFCEQYPHKGGSGELILAMWMDSDCSYKDLVAALRDEDIRLDTLANNIDSYFSTF